jgi:hypothetical protein
LIVKYAVAPNPPSAIASPDLGRLCTIYSPAVFVARSAGSAQLSISIRLTDVHVSNVLECKDGLALRTCSSIRSIGVWYHTTFDVLSPCDTCTWKFFGYILPTDRETSRVRVGVAMQRGNLCFSAIQMLPMV